MPEPHSSAHDGYIRRYMQTGERRIIGQRREVEALHKDGRRIPVDLGISEMRIGSRRLFIGVIRDLSARLEIEQLKTGLRLDREPRAAHAADVDLGLARAARGRCRRRAAGEGGAADRHREAQLRAAGAADQRHPRPGEGRVGPAGASASRRSALKPIVQQAIDLESCLRADLRRDDRARAATATMPACSSIRDRLIQVLTNILSNAAKFSPRGGRDSVAIRTEADSVRVSVRDHGPGIAPEFQPRIFQRFAQADSSDSRAKGGTGLGLSIAKTIVERLGGSIGFDSAPGEGATFYITLPMRQEITTPVRCSATSLAPALQCSSAKTIPTSRARLQTCWRPRACGFRGAERAPGARSRWTRLRFDVALVDLHLPDADGLELVTDLRTHDATRALPVIVMTARARTSADAERFSTLQLADWLQKPIDPQPLLDAIHNVLSGTARPARPYPACGGRRVADGAGRGTAVGRGRRDRGSFARAGASARRSRAASTW